MQKLTKLFTATCVIFLFFTFNACEKKSNITSGIEGSIPADASIVLLMNTKQLMEKADFDELLKSSFYNEFLKIAEQESAESLAFFKDPESAGIDLKSNMGFYVSISENNNKPAPEFACIFPIADMDKIKNKIASVIETDSILKIMERNGYQFISLKDDINLIHNDKILAFINFDEEVKINNILNPSGDNIKYNDNFNRHQKEGKDIMFWMHADEIVDAALKVAGRENEDKLKGVLSAAHVTNDVLKDNYMSFYYDFKNGEIDGGASFDFNKELVETFGNFFPSKLAIDYSKYIPADNLAFAISFGINPDGILQYLSKLGFDVPIENYMAMVDPDLNLGKIRDGITGDMALGVYAPPAKGADPIIVLALGLKDKTFIEGLINKYGFFAGITKDGDKYIMESGESMDPDESSKKIEISIQDEVMIISNSSKQLENSLKGGKNEILAELQNGWMGTYINYEAIEKHHDDITSMFPIDNESLGVAKLMEKYNEIEDVKVLFKGGQIDVKTDLKTKDINSLKRLIQLAELLYQDREKIKAEIEKNLEEDEFEGFEEEMINT
ncbi:MAG: DUF4836 family protein [Saprospiraceae bacterium]|nr:DUF4836 family protein [Saprospiraceae bacterium]